MVFRYVHEEYTRDVAIEDSMISPMLPQMYKNKHHGAPECCIQGPLLLPHVWMATTNVRTGL